MSIVLNREMTAAGPKGKESTGAAAARRTPVIVLAAAFAIAYAGLIGFGIAGQARLDEGHRTVIATQAELRDVRAELTSMQNQADALRAQLRPVVTPGDPAYDRSDLQLSQG